MDRSLRLDQPAPAGAAPILEVLHPHAPPDARTGAEELRRYGDAVEDLDRAALVVVDVQQGFDDPWWGPRDNPDCDRNIAALVDRWAERRRPLVYVRHDSADPTSPLHPDAPGNALKPYLAAEPDLTVTKSVNSSFHGTPDLDAWLREQGTTGMVVCGITTNHCCETTARVGGNLGHRVLFALDATHTFDRSAPDGSVVAAADLGRITATNLHGEFAEVVTTRELLQEDG